MDYQQIEAELVGRGVISVEKLSIEDTKFLGGDLDHTHLVKGLDYALLQKERMRMTKEQEETLQREKQAAKKQAAAAASAAAMRREDMQVNSAVARNTLAVLFNRPKSDMAAMFLPRRTAFVYEFDPEEASGLDTDIPTTLRRSKADCPPLVESIFASVDAGVLERIVKIMGYMKFNTGGKPGRKLKKKEREEILQGLSDAQPASKSEPTLKGSLAALAPPKPAEAEEDIFGDAGADYKPELPERKKKEAGAAAKKEAPSYFGEKDDMADIPNAGEYKGALPGPPPGPGAYPPPPPRPPGGYDASSYAPQPYGAPAGPAFPGYDAYYAARGQGYMDPDQYEAYVQANVAYQASMDPEYQALLAKQAMLQSLEEEGFEEGELGAGAWAGGRTLTQQEKDAGLASVFKRDETKWRSKVADEKEKDPNYVDDFYSECYPSYMAFAQEVVDSDDEDYTKMDTRGKGASRYDFATEEEWEKYKESKEAMPKAAYQFGVKMGDGRKSHKGLEKARDQKLDTQLNKIEKLLTDKGHDHHDAFGKTPKRGTTYTDSELNVNTKKRQRI